MKINVNMSGMEVLQAKLRGLADKKIKVAAVAALNDAGYVGSTAVRKEMSKVFDRPTPYILKSAVYFKAGLAGKKVRVPGVFDLRGNPLLNKLDADRLEVVIDLSGDGNKQSVSPSMVLNAQIFGGQRRHKRHEMALKAVGVLPADMFIVPGEAAQIDSYGNMNVGQIRQILSWFNAAQMTSGYLGNMTQKKRDKLRAGSMRKGNVTNGFEYFVVQPGQRRQFQRANGKTGNHAMQPGIYQRIFLGQGTAIKPVMIFVKAPAYKQRLDFYRIAGDAAQGEFARAFPMYLEKLLKERGL